MRTNTTKENLGLAYAPLGGLGREHGPDEVHSFWAIFAEAPQAPQRLLVPQNVTFALVTVTKWMSACRKAVIVKATKGEYVDRLCQLRFHPCPVRSFDVVASSGPGLATEDLWCPPPKSPPADRTTHSRRVAHPARFKLPTEPKVGYQHSVPT